MKDSRDIRKVITGDIKEYESCVSALKTGESIIDSIGYVTPLTIRIAPSKSMKIDPFVVEPEDTTVIAPPLYTPEPITKEMEKGIP